MLNIFQKQISYTLVLKLRKISSKETFNVCDFFKENVESLNSHEYSYCRYFSKHFIYDKSPGFSWSSDTKHTDIRYNVRYINNAWNNNVTLKRWNAQIWPIWMVKG